MKKKLLAGLIFLMVLTIAVTSPAEQSTADPAGMDPAQRQVLIEEMEREQGLAVTWSLEDKAKVFPGNGLPTEDDITQEEAFQAARKALQEQYGVSAEVLAGLTPYSFFIVDNPEKRFYTISFFTDPTAQSGAISYSVEVSSTGEIIVVYTEGNG